MLAWRALLYGTAMALIDTGMLGLVKEISTDGVKSLAFMVIPSIVYAIQPWIFLSALKYESLIVMNLMWDLLSDVLVTLLGLFYFGEKISRIRLMGLLLGMVSLSLLAYKE
jgi:hypothetical protein